MKSIFEKDAVKVLCYVAGCLILGALLSPPLFFFGKWIAAAMEGSPLLENEFMADTHESVADSPFDRYFDRAVLAAALLLLWPLVKWLKRGGEFSFGLRPDAHRWSNLIAGFVLAAGVLHLMGWWYVDQLYFKPNLNVEDDLISSGLITAAVVAPLEELVFRCFFFALILRTMRPLPGGLFIAFFFAIIHFMNAPKSADIPADQITWSTGFWVVGLILGNFVNIGFLLGERFATYLAIGLILGYARWKTGHIWLPIGLHAGWVFGDKYFGGTTVPKATTKYGDHLPWVGTELTSGLAPIIALLFTTALLLIYLRLRTGSIKPIA